ncbi:unnamed protein product [Prunus armeniaca]
MASLPILLKVFNCQEVGDGTDFLFTFCPKLFSLSLEAIMKTQSDDFRLNCVGVPQVLLREFSEGDLKSSSEGNVVLLFGNPVGGRGSTLALPLLFVQRLTLVKSEGRVEWTGEGTSERFDFRASRAVSPP